MSALLFGIIGSLFVFLLVFIAIYFFGGSDDSNSFTRKYPLSKVDKMTGLEFEEYLCRFFRLSGYKVVKTKASGDFGVDLIVYLDRKNKIAIQAKRYKSNVSLGAVQEVVAGRLYYNCQQGAVFTNSYYTKSAKELAKSTNVDLIDRDDLIRFMKNGQIRL